MPHLELSVTLRADQQAAVEAALEEVGALAVTLLDADAGTGDENAILEPGVGETPLWPSLVLNALFETDVDRSGLVHVLADLVPQLAPDQLVFREVADADWTRAWMDQFQPMRFGERLWIYPWNIEPPDDPARVVVRLDPGLAFGTGTHPTTALCLEWLDGLDLRGRRVLDYGCGSGILAIAAALLDAERVLAIDNDPQALVASADNARRNGVAERIDLAGPGAGAGGEGNRFEVLVANILAGPLQELAPVFAERIADDGLLALSGILVGQHEDLLARYAVWFDDLAVNIRDGWVRIDGRRRRR
ncbi:MAG: 50S ribosomal protein L11 methyltransferase [Xanthomonadales bacterium]|nr:50S ribosomal protein L11 methyltransferase [Xanthomonadales bacterium]